ncbi:hypothetical protein VNI00_002140 [Paramarasmius palmivorus]|uniref:F-box domain-containing protein n=1 Tax=Paramarasmius palmivorus TaxID=297713 RepID=A0AAW0E0L3_9AGAR
MTTPAVPTSLCRNCQTLLGNNHNAIHQHRPLDIQVLRSNRLPTQTEASQIPIFVETSTAELERLEKEIRVLEVQRDALRQDIERRRSWLAPIRRLPVEILGEIFSFACLGDFSLDISSTRSYRECPVPECEQCESERAFVLKNIIAPTYSLSHVCHHWRCIINVSPQLWSSLRLDLTQMEEVHENLVGLYITRSTRHPLKIDIYDPPDVYEWDDYHEASDAIQVLGQAGFNIFCSVIAELDRFKEFSYRFHTDAVLDFVNEEFRTSETPFLTSLIDESVYPRGAEWFWDLYDHIPEEILPVNLQTVKVKHHRNYADLLRTLPHITTLRSLHLHDFLPDIIPGPLSHPAHSMNLRDFTITTARPLSYLDILFTSVTLPNLTSLQILTSKRVSDSDNKHMTDEDSEAVTYRADQLAALHTLIKRSGCSLRDLTLHVEPFSSNAIISLLELVPSLVGVDIEVRISQTHFPSILADFSNRMISPQPLLPCLQRLAIHEHSYQGYREYDLNDTFVHASSVVSMLENREMEKSIVDASVSFGRVTSYALGVKSYDLPAGLAKRVDALCAKGVKCRVTLPVMFARDNAMVETIL